MRGLSLSITEEVLDLGVKALAARITGLQNKHADSEFEAYKSTELEKIRTEWGDKNYKDDPVLAGFRDLHAKVGKSNRKYVASPESLRRVFLKQGRFPHVNTVVDIYNLVSLRTGLALGAHDIEKIEGDVTLRLTKGDEIFVPLGEAEPVSIPPGEYCYVDDGNNIICRLEVLQVEPTKITTETADLLVLIQGNANTAANYVKQAAEEVCRLITKYCGGSYSLLGTP